MYQKAFKEAEKFITWTFITTEVLFSKLLLPFVFFFPFKNVGGLLTDFKNIYTSSGEQLY